MLNTAQVHMNELAPRIYGLGPDGRVAAEQWSLRMMVWASSSLEAITRASYRLSSDLEISDVTVSEVLEPWLLDAYRTDSQLLLASLPYYQSSVSDDARLYSVALSAQRVVRLQPPTGTSPAPDEGTERSGTDDLDPASTTY